MRPSEDPRGVVLKYTWPNSGKLELEPGIYSYSCQLEPEVLQHLVISLPIGSATDSSVCQCTPAAPCGRHLPSSQSKAETKPSQSDHRTLPARVVAPTHEWRRLEHCVSAWELGECLLHALLGWLRAIRAFSQGDGAAGGRGSEATTWNHERSHAVPTRLAQQQDSGYSDGDFWTDCGEEVAVAAQRLEHALANLNAGLSTEFRALLIDEDMVANSGEYFISSVHGTPEFMSDSLRMALRHDDKDYVQNPVDDLHSFMWTALWATVFNRRALEDAGLMEQQSVRMWPSLL
ncbi:hypothetical protein C8T65DRAFT_37573 [Cerioporus squamosus]|nr:hypothetical protein C8T65DRAFT_37573 [Cerioporus squamosus]